MDLGAVRTFVAVADAGQFKRAGEQLALTQQGVSKRIAALERSLGVPLFDRSPRGAQLSVDGRVFLPHARELIAAADRAALSVRLDHRALRVDVIGRRLPAAALLRAFHLANPSFELQIVTQLLDAASAVAALQAGTINATIRAVTTPLPSGIASAPVLDEPLQLLTGPDHVLSRAKCVTPSTMAGHRIWMPGNAVGTEWRIYYEALASTFGLTIDSIGPDFGIEALLEVLADSADIATFVGEHLRLLWPDHYGLRRVHVREPTLVYPHSLLWRVDDSHPALPVLRAHLTGDYRRLPNAWRFTPASTDVTEEF
jgi:DNA-binding transcriptional LysR family regulator